MKPQFRRQPHFSKSASVDPAEQRDVNSSRGNVVRSVTAQKRTYNLYPWGDNNLLPNERIKLLRTNGDAQNLIEARADFLYGGGFGFFKHSQKAGIVTREPFTNSAIEEYIDAYGMNDLSDVTNQMCTSLIESANIFVNRTLVDGLPIYSVKDSVTCRAAIAKTKNVETWLLNSDWSNSESVQKNTLPVLAYNEANKHQEETIFCFGNSSPAFDYMIFKKYSRIVPIAATGSGMRFGNAA